MRKNHCSEWMILLSFCGGWGRNQLSAQIADLSAGGVSANSYAEYIVCRINSGRRRAYSSMGERRIADRIGPAGMAWPGLNPWKGGPTPPLGGASPEKEHQPADDQPG